VYKGTKGLRSLYLDVLKEGKESLVMGSSGKLIPALGEHFYIQFQRQQKELGNKVKIIFDEAVREEFPTKGISNSEVRFVPENTDTPSHTLIFGNKVVIHLFELTPMAICIESEGVAKSYRNFFNHMWEIAKK
jgi:hypothetical protein